MALAALALGTLPGCSSGGDPPNTSTTTAAPTTTAPTTEPDDAALVPILLSAADLPDGFAADTEVDDTVTGFCAGQDAAAGLRASGRAIVGFRRTPAGASVIELVFRFDADGATKFVEQAESLFDGCSEVPDATGLAFAYEPSSATVASAIDGADARASRYGVSVGSGNLTLNVAVLRRGDLGVLVAVLGLDQPRSVLDDLADTAFTSALAKLPAGP